MNTLIPLPGLSVNEGNGTRHRNLSWTRPMKTGMLKPTDSWKVSSPIGLNGSLSWELSPRGVQILVRVLTTV
jgi:hypothetical protein